jgi:hypothetical protein
MPGKAESQTSGRHHQISFASSTEKRSYPRILQRSYSQTTPLEHGSQPPCQASAEVAFGIKK